jgi:hypothetical protein
LLEAFTASKSSLSSSLNFLLNLTMMNDFNKIGETNRFFGMSEKYMKIHFQESIEKMERELSILCKLKACRNAADERGLQKFKI